MSLPQDMVRPEVMAHVRRSVDKNRKLLHLLASAAKPLGKGSAENG